VPGQTAREAVENHVRPVQWALSCVTDAVPGHRGGTYVSEKSHVLTLGTDNGSTFLSGADLKFSFIQHYSILQLEGDQPYRVRTAYYAYGLEDLEGDEIFAYHWHPYGISPVGYPHLHLKHGARIGRPELIRGHLPTGRVSLEDVLTLVIEQFDVKPLRSDWREVLEESADMFRKNRTWA